MAIDKRKNTSTTNTSNDIVTASGLSIRFDNENNIITIETPFQNKIVLNDRDKNISVVDGNNNTIVTSESGISLQDAFENNITMSSSGIEISSNSNIQLVARQDIRINGMDIDLNAKMALDCKAAATANFSSSGNTVVKGAMVMIN